MVPEGQNCIFSQAFIPGIGLCGYSKGSFVVRAIAIDKVSQSGFKSEMIRADGQQILHEVQGGELSSSTEPHRSHCAYDYTRWSILSRVYRSTLLYLPYMSACHAYPFRCDWWVSFSIFRP